MSVGLVFTACWIKSPCWRRSRVLVVVAGMEGALPGFIGGLVSAPIIAVPTSMAWGQFNGLAALLDDC